MAEVLFLAYRDVRADSIELTTVMGAPELPLQKWIFHHHKGKLASLKLDFAKATEYFRECMTIVASRPRGMEGNAVLFGVTCNSIGELSMHSGDISKSVSLFYQSKDALEQFRDSTRDLTLTPLINLGYAFWSSGVLEIAEGFFEQAYEMTLELGAPNKQFLQVTPHQFTKLIANLVRLGQILYGLGNVKEGLGDLDKSLSLHEQSVERFKSSGGAVHRMADAYVKISDNYVARHQPHLAL
jgi:tetratricopeptide (TPR) repeat protein